METPGSKQKIILVNAVIGLGVGFLSFMPITYLYLFISIFISDLYHFNTNTDAFMGSYLCCVPALLVSLVGGISGERSAPERATRILVQF